MMEVQRSHFNTINDKIESLQCQTCNNEEYIRTLENKLQSLMQLLGFQKQFDYNFPLKREEEFSLCFEIEQMLKDINKLSSLIVANIERNIFDINNLLDTVLGKQLIIWKRNQQLAAIGVKFNARQLDNLQNWCVKSFEIIKNTLTQIDAVRRSITSAATMGAEKFEYLIMYFSHFENQVSELLSRLVNEAFIVEQQPPQIIKKNTRFSATARHLLSGLLGIQVNSSKFKVSIITESQVSDLLEKKEVNENITGEISNNTGEVRYDQDTKQLSILFKNMQLKRFEREKRNESESVVKEKFCLYFSARISACGQPDFKMWTISLPVTVVVHTNQESHAAATILWDNGFAKPGRKPFVIPEQVYWKELAFVLSSKFEQSTGRRLSDSDLKYLAEKLFNVHSGEYETMLCSWSMFAKMPLADRRFSFWEWFYDIMKLTREHLKLLWQEESIMGFVYKKEAENLLSNCPNGTFLLRFSDSQLGAITIALIQGTCEPKEFAMYGPYDDKFLRIKILADIIKDTNEFQFLYPGISKEQAFGSHYTHVKKTKSDGYKKPSLKIVAEEEPKNEQRTSEPSNQNIPPFSSLQPENPFISPHFDEKPTNEQRTSEPSNRNIPPFSSLQPKKPKNEQRISEPNDRKIPLISLPQPENQFFDEEMNRYEIGPTYMDYTENPEDLFI